jgi:hypothetical protein
MDIAAEQKFQTNSTGDPLYLVVTYSGVNFIGRIVISDQSLGWGSVGGWQMSLRKTKQRVVLLAAIKRSMIVKSAAEM